MLTNPASKSRGPGTASLAILIVAALAAGAAASASVLEGPSPERSLAEVLKELRASGLDIIYSDELVRPEMRIRNRPASGSPRKILDEVLAAHGLAARRGPADRILVVKAPAPGTLPRSPNRGAGAEMKLLFRDGRGQPMRLTVSVPERGFRRTTDNEGRVRLPVEPGTYDAEGWLPGYRPWQADNLTAEAGETLKVPVTLVAEGEALDSQVAGVEFLLALRERYRYEETIDVSAEPVPHGGPDPLSVSPPDVKNTAGAFENVFRTLPLLPSVTPVNEIQSRISVRGGGPDQNLTIVDGVEVYNPFRLEALVSAFNPETVESFELTTGVMSPRHGDRLSSALEVRTRPGRRSSGVAGTAALSLTDANVVLEGPLPRTRTGTWLLSGRRTYYEWIAEPIAKIDLPGFQDLQFRIDWPWNDRFGLSVWGLHSRESLQVRENLVPVPGDFTDHREGVEYGGRNAVFSGSFRAPLAGLSSTTTLSLYRNPQDGGQVEAIVPDRPQWSPTYERHVRIEDLALRQTFLLQASPGSKWETGFEVHRLNTRWAMRGRGALAALWNFRGPSLAPTPWGSRGDELDAVVDVDTRRQATRWGAWLQGTLEPSTRIILQPGLRIEGSSVNRETAILPRFGMTWQLDPSTRLGVALGWHSQSPGFEKVLMADTFLDFGGSEPLPLRSERSRHAALSLERDLAPGFAARVELYHKSFDRIIVGRLETEDERLRRLAGYEIPPDFPGGPPLEPLISSVPVNGGRGTARGFEVSLRRADSSSKLSGALSYSFGLTQREAYGYVHPFDYDRRHAVTATVNLQLSRGFGLSAAWRAASGLPYTPFRPVVSFGLEQSRDQPPRRTPARGWFGPGRPPASSDPNTWPYLYDLGYGALSDLNAARHPFYSRLDFRARFNPSWGGGRWELYLDVFNALGSRSPYRSNGPFFLPDLYRDPATGEYRVAKTRLEGTVRPILPSFGVRVRF